MSMKTLLDEKIEAIMSKLEKMDPGTKEYNLAVDSVTKFSNLRLELDKLETSEIQTEKQRREESFARWVKILGELGISIGSLKLMHWCFKTSLVFEEKGSITSQAGKKILDLIFRK